jgi:hypothetical protein
MSFAAYHSQRNLPEENGLGHGGFNHFNFFSQLGMALAREWRDDLALALVRCAKLNPRKERAEPIASALPPGAENPP